MTVLTDIGQLATCPPDAPDAGLIPDAALVWDAGRIVWAGPEADLPDTFADADRQSADGRLVIPGLVDCHTHLAFAGDRADEFVERIKGTPYLEVARRGGGIQKTVRATRAASDADLEAAARERLAAMARQGVTTVEAKTGYGLTFADELRVLRLYRRLGEEGPQRIVATLLAAHIVPPEYADDRAAYVRLIVDEMLPAVANEGLADFVDVFVEETAFTAFEAWTIFAAAHAYGLGAKLHADQLSDGDGAALAAEVGAASADHLECVSPDGIRALAEAGVVAVSLPIATLVLGQEPLPARALLDAGVRVAVATDLNPGSAPSASLGLALWLACTRQRMTPEEALRGATAEAAHSLRLADGTGSLTPGSPADVALVDAPSLDAWLSTWRAEPVRRTVIAGETVWERRDGSGTEG
ncbi:imidazolonepropionase [Rubrivirga sp. SAORIC476]|uniref:imidazolonepropionase n=1 Tax=Rubrivirga sp. SAORIC476 TaxID=1961794 RepID=UPI000BA8D957|nr:imidazolonepropionase [Rubrivirga sp. SAORIC476]PAP81365.1 imidazolonepropionase [Rubrivirga sp. SAORIC476]